MENRKYARLIAFATDFRNVSIVSAIASYAHKALLKWSKNVKTRKSNR